MKCLNGTEGVDKGLLECRVFCEGGGCGGEGAEEEVVVVGHAGMVEERSRGRVAGELEDELLGGCMFSIEACSVPWSVQARLVLLFSSSLTSSDHVQSLDHELFVLGPGRLVALSRHEAWYSMFSKLLVVWELRHLMQLSLLAY